MKTFSIIIPALNAAETLAACLESLQADTIPPGYDAREIIVIDNGSSDATSQIARDAGVRVELCAKRGQGAARNMGLRVSTGDIIACTDSDCTVDAGWASALAAQFADPRVAVAGGEIIAARQESLAEKHAAARRLLNQQDAMNGLPGFWLPFAITACAAFRRSALDEVGYFDETIHPSEDADLSWRMQLGGWRLAYAPEARVRHFHRATMLRYWRQIYGYGFATANLFGKYKAPMGRRVWLGLDYSGDIRRSIMRAPVRLLTGRNRYERLEPMIDLICQTASVAGRLRGSMNNGILLF